MRNFARITIDDLKAKIEEAYDAKGRGYRDFVTLTPTVEKDLSKVHFDCENFNSSPVGSRYDKIMGYHTLYNGLTFLGCSAGGDWEWPVFFIIYFDGKKLRAYIPKDGNICNYKAKYAIGNCDWAEWEESKNDRYPHGEHNYPDQKFAMSIDLFKEYTVGFSKKEKELYYRDIDADRIGESLCDVDKMIIDIKTRIIEK